MIHTAPIELITAVRGALLQAQSPNTWRSVKRPLEFVEEGWVMLTELTDELEMYDRRIYVISQLIEDLCQVFELPIRRVMSRPQNHSIEVYLHHAISVIDAAALVVNLERLGFAVDPAPFVDAVKPELSRSRRISRAGYDVEFFERTRGRQLTCLTTDRAAFSPQIERFKTGSYHVEFMSGDDCASLTVRGPNHRPRKAPVSVKCAYCGMTYMQGDLASATKHRRQHLRKRHSYDPVPTRRLIERMAKSSTGDVVDGSAPKWMHHEAYERAMMFKRELGFDFPQWAQPPTHGKTSEKGTAYLLTSTDEPGTIVGACGFRKRQDGGWKIDWAWIAPRWRQKGVLKRYWQRFLESHGDFQLEYPLSPDMTAFLRKYGTDTQKAELDRRSSPVVIPEPAKDVPQNEAPRTPRINFQ